MKWILIIVAIHNFAPMAATTAVFDTQEACHQARDDVKKLRWTRMFGQLLGCDKVASRVAPF